MYFSLPGPLWHVFAGLRKTWTKLAQTLWFPFLSVLWKFYWTLKFLAKSCIREVEEKNFLPYFPTLCFCPRGIQSPSSKTLSNLCSQRDFLPANKITKLQVPHVRDFYGYKLQVRQRLAVAATKLMLMVLHVCHHKKLVTFWDWGGNMNDSARDPIYVVRNSVFTLYLTWAPIWQPLMIRI